MDLPLKSNRNFLTVNAADGLEVIKGLASPVRVRIDGCCRSADRST